MAGTDQFRSWTWETSDGQVAVLSPAKCPRCGRWVSSKNAAVELGSDMFGLTVKSILVVCAPCGGRVDLAGHAAGWELPNWWWVEDDDE